MAEAPVLDEENPHACMNQALQICVSRRTTLQRLKNRAQREPSSPQLHPVNVDATMTCICIIVRISRGNISDQLLTVECRFPILDPSVITWEFILADYKTLHSKILFANIVLFYAMSTQIPTNLAFSFPFFSSLPQYGILNLLHTSSDSNR